MPWVAAGTAVLLQCMHELGRLLGAAVAAAHCRRDALRVARHTSSAQLGAQLGSPGWLADHVARQALDKMALVSGGHNVCVTGRACPSSWLGGAGFCGQERAESL